MSELAVLVADLSHLEEKYKEMVNTLPRRGLRNEKQSIFQTI